MVINKFITNVKGCCVIKRITERVVIDNFKIVIKHDYYDSWFSIKMYFKQT